FTGSPPDVSVLEAITTGCYPAVKHDTATDPPVHIRAIFGKVSLTFQAASTGRSTRVNGWSHACARFGRHRRVRPSGGGLPGTGRHGTRRRRGRPPGRWLDPGRRSGRGRTGAGDLPRPGRHPGAAGLRTVGPARRDRQLRPAPLRLARL